MLTCREMTELMTDYLEGRLTFGDRLRFQLHLGTCRHCRAYLKQMRHGIQTLGRLPDQPIPKELEAELLRRFRSWKKSS